MGDPRWRRWRGRTPGYASLPGASEASQAAVRNKAPRSRRRALALALALGSQALLLTPARAQTEGKAQPATSPTPAAATQPGQSAPATTGTKPTSGEVCLYCDPKTGAPRPRRDLHWHDHWNRVGLAEAVTIAAATGAFITTLFVTPEDEAEWSGPILVDSGVRSSLRLRERSEREAAATVSDALIVGSIVHPVIVDNLLVTWLGRQSPEVAWQMFVINAQAYALTLSINSVTKRIAARGRPYADECVDDPNYSAKCENNDRFKSFYSGHAAVTATGAGLLCAHHTQLELYGDPALDTATCVLGVTMTAATGALRIASDNHWTSDVLLGHLMGYASGYLMPTLLYYQEFRIRPEPPHDTPRPQVALRTAVVPVVTDSSLQLKLIGMF